MELPPAKPLTEDEIKHAARYASGQWALLSHEPETGLSVYMKREGNQIRFAEFQDASQIIAENAARAIEWTGWNDPKHKHGAVVAAIPKHVYWDMIRESGQQADGQYDRDHFLKKLNDRDFRKLRTGGGKV